MRREQGVHHPDGDGIARAQRIGVQRGNREVAVARDRGRGDQTFEGFHLLYRPVDLGWRRPDREGLGARCGDHAGGLDHCLVGQRAHRAVVLRVDVLDVARVVVERGDEVAGRVGVSGTAAPGELFGLCLEFGIPVQREQVALQLLHHFGAGRAGLELFQLRGELLLGEVIIAVIRTGNRAEAADQRRGERPRDEVFHRDDILGGDLFVDPDQLPETRTPVDEDVRRVDEVVDPRKLHAELFGRDVQQTREAVVHVDRDIAQPDDLAPPGVAQHRLGDDARGIREVDEPGVGTQALHVPDDVEDDGNRAEGLEHAARPVRLLPDDPVLERDALVEHAGVELPDADLGRDVVRPLERRLAVERRVNREREAGRGHHQLREAADDLELLAPFRDVDEPELAHRQVLPALDQAFDELRGIGRAAPEGRDFQAEHFIPPR